MKYRISDMIKSFVFGMAGCKLSEIVCDQKINTECQRHGLDLLVLIQELVKSGELVEVKYTILSDRSFLLPKDTVVRVSEPVRS